MRDSSRWSAEVALGQVGIIFALECFRLARDNAAWYRLLGLAGACDALVADADGVHYPGLFNDRLVLGMEGIISEAELHVLRTGLPVGLVWGETDKETRFHPDEAVTGVLRVVFTRFACAARYGPPGCGCVNRACCGRCRPPDTSAAAPSRSPGSSPPTTLPTTG